MTDWDQEQLNKASAQTDKSITLEWLAIAKHPSLNNASSCNYNTAHAHMDHMAYGWDIGLRVWPGVSWPSLLCARGLTVHSVGSVSLSVQTRGKKCEKYRNLLPVRFSAKTTQMYMVFKINARCWISVESWVDMFCTAINKYHPADLFTILLADATSTGKRYKLYSGCKQSCVCLLTRLNYKLKHRWNASACWLTQICLGPRLAYGFFYSNVR